MALKALKCRSSKRQKASLRYKKIKKIAASKRKKAKDAKKLPRLSKKQRLIQVPNICPFKADILAEVEVEKQRREQEKLQRKEQQKLENLQKKNESLQSMVADAEQRALMHDAQNPAGAEDEGEFGNLKKGKEGSLKAYFKEFKKVIDAADVILEVCDARDPMGTRCLEVEKIIREAPGQKKHVLIVNKSDLVPRENLEKWLKYLRKSGPVIPFKATTQTQKTKLGDRKFKTVKYLETSPCIGADLLKALLANYCRSENLRTSIRVGIVGLPNVGKSSLINSLKRKRACMVGASPGITKQMQEVQIDSHIKLLDSPGIIFQRPQNEDCNQFYALKNAQKVTEIQDPFPLAEDILKRGTITYFCKLYDIAEYHTTEEFLARKAVKMGSLAKGGVPDVKKAARSLIEDWNTGKIKYCTQPPVDNLNEIHLAAEIVSENVAEFDIENFNQSHEDVLKQLGSQYENSFKMKDDDDAMAKKEDVMEFDSTGPVSMRLSKNDCNTLEEWIRGCGKIIENKDEEMDEITVKSKKRKIDDYAEDAKKYKNDPVFQVEGNQTVNKNKKQELKKKQKLAKRNDRKVTDVADVLDSFSFGSSSAKKKKTGDDNDNYDFDEDYDM
uniref:Guanine nucleotide-binding protein-like 3 homolog n=1 Tax=Corethrella appendiculata TaxID=1370023 RepID=U5EYQ8_9DIPT